MNPCLNAAYGRIVFLDAAKIVNAAAVIAELMTNGIDAQRWLFVDNVILQGMLGGSQIGQLLLDLNVYGKWTRTDTRNLGGVCPEILPADRTNLIQTYP